MEKENIKSATDKNLKEEKGEIIEVNKDKLENLYNRLDRLESAASKAGLSKYDSEHKIEQKKRIKLVVYEGKVVENWSNMLANKVEKNPKSGVWEEDQVIAVKFFEEKEPVELPYVIFNRNYTKLEVEVDKEEINISKKDLDKYGDRTFHVETTEGKKYVVGKKFVN